MALGSTIHDKATVTGSPFTVTGDVVFHSFGLNALGQPVSAGPVGGPGWNADTCPITTSENGAGETVALGGGADDQATGSAGSSSFGPLHAGKYA